MPLVSLTLLCTVHTENTCHHTTQALQEPCFPPWTHATTTHRGQKQKRALRYNHYTQHTASDSTLTYLDACNHHTQRNEGANSGDGCQAWQRGKQDGRHKIGQGEVQRPLIVFLEVQQGRGSRDIIMIVANTTPITEQIQLCPLKHAHLCPLQQTFDTKKHSNAQTCCAHSDIHTQAFNTFNT